MHLDTRTTPAVPSTTNLITFLHRRALPDAHTCAYCLRQPHEYIHYFKLFLPIVSLWGSIVLTVHCHWKQFPCDNTMRWLFLMHIAVNLSFRSFICSHVETLSVYTESDAYTKVSIALMLPRINVKGVHCNVVYTRPTIYLRSSSLATILSSWQTMEYKLRVHTICTKGNKTHNWITASASCTCISQQHQTFTLYIQPIAYF